jgi:RNA polymerase sigma-70 factor (ECF subfamily)
MSAQQTMPMPIPTLLADALPRAYVAAFRLLRDRDEAHEACQEAATRALEHAGRYDSSRPFYPWFARIVRNHCLDRIAARKRQRPSDQSEELADRASLAGRGAPFAAASLADAEATLLASERARRVLAAIEELAPELRDVIELRHFQDASYEEIAAALEIPLGTVMSRLYRARSKLRDALSAVTDEQSVAAGGPAGAKERRR